MSLTGVQLHYACKILNDENLKGAIYQYAMPKQQNRMVILEHLNRFIKDINARPERKEQDKLVNYWLDRGAIQKEVATKLLRCANNNLLKDCLCVASVTNNYLSLEKFHQIEMLQGNEFIQYDS